MAPCHSSNTRSGLCPFGTAERKAVLWCFLQEVTLQLETTWCQERIVWAPTLFVRIISWHPLQNVLPLLSEPYWHFSSPEAVSPTQPDFPLPAQLLWHKSQLSVRTISGKTPKTWISGRRTQFFLPSVHLPSLAGKESGQLNMETSFFCCYYLFISEIGLLQLLNS